MSLSLDPRTTALVLIDLQKGILAYPLDPHSAAQVSERSIELARAFRAAGAPVVLVNVAFSEADRPGQEVDAPSPLPKGGHPQEWSELLPALEEIGADVRITKRQWGAFHGTELDLQLRRRGMKTIVLAGIATNIGVEQTAREAWQHDYGVVIAEDATTSMGPEWHQFSVKNILPRISRVRSTTEILEALQPAK